MATGYVRMGKNGFYQVWAEGRYSAFATGAASWQDGLRILMREKARIESHDQCISALRKARGEA